MLRKSNVYFYLLTRNNSSTIYARISVEGEKSSRSTGQKIDKKYWNQDTQRVSSSHPQSNSINETLSVIENQVREAENALVNQRDVVTLERLISEMEGENEAISFIELFKEHNEKMEQLADKGEVAEATYAKYCTMLKHTKSFLNDRYDKDDIYLSKLNLKFVDDFEHWFKMEKEISHNTTFKYLKHIKKIINIALRRGYIRRDPFDGFSMSKKEKTPTYLTMDELKRIEEYDFSDCERLERVRDCFVFSCYTGLAYSDLESLDKELDFYRDKEGDIWLQQHRTKTNEPAHLLLFGKAKEVYDKYSESPNFLPVISNQKMNKYLKEIAQCCEIKKNLTTHCGRHTFATSVTLDNDIPLETVQILLGHRDRRSTAHYARVTNSKISSDMKKLRDRIASNG